MTRFLFDSSQLSRADRTHWDWTSVRGIDPLAATPPLDFHTRPGRNVSLTLGFDW